jgi:hypothetical protein
MNISYVRRFLTDKHFLISCNASAIVVWYWLLQLKICLLMGLSKSEQCEDRGTNT